MVPPFPGKKIVFCTDTRPTEKTKVYSKNAEILIHDGMFDEKLRDIAEDGGHSTVIEAAELALNAEVKKLILTHISSRYESDTSILEEQAKKIFPETLIAKDFMKITIWMKNKIKDS